jgi:hypothetical protein
MAKTAKGGAVSSQREEERCSGREEGHELEAVQQLPPAVRRDMGRDGQMRRLGPLTTRS